MSEGFRNVPGVPEGWELVHACRQAESGEHYLDGKGHLSFSTLMWRTSACYAIIRKVEQTDRYRQFANAEEFEPHRNRWISRNWTDRTPAARGAYKPTAYNDRGIWTSVENFETYEQMFDEGRCFDDDGTPFGVRIDE
jgi:uncharacterized protein YbdZ (MbtH family)